VKPVHIGCSGWNYRHWRETVYPKGVPASRWLEHYATMFDTVEVNSTFYRPAAPEAARKWAERVKENDRFRFALKLWRRFTHEREAAFTREEVDAVRAGLDPIADAGRLGAVLLQFPWSFRNDEANREWPLHGEGAGALGGAHARAGR